MNFFDIALLADTAAGQATGAAGFLSKYGMIIVIIGMFVLLYFFMIRPSKKENEQKQNMMSQMAVGDTVLTSSGFYGVVIDIGEDVIIVEFGSNKNCRIPMQKAAITSVEKPEDAAANAKAAEERKAEREAKQGQGVLGGLFGKKDKADSKENSKTADKK